MDKAIFAPSDSSVCLLFQYSVNNVAILVVGTISPLATGSLFPEALEAKIAIQEQWLHHFF